MVPVGTEVERLSLAMSDGADSELLMGVSRFLAVNHAGRGELWRTAWTIVAVTEGFKRASLEVGTAVSFTPSDIFSVLLAVRTELKQSSALSHVVGRP